MVQKKMISRILANRKLKETVSDVAREFFSDSEVQLLIKDVLRVAVVDNSELRRSIEQTWRSGEAKRAMKMANGRLESTITRIGQSLFGSPNGKITDEFARVLRNRVLHKDDRWLVIKPGAAEETSPSDQPQQTLALTVASGEREFPISFGQHRELSEPDETSDSDE
jgi:hypothetical protein